LPSDGQAWQEEIMNILLWYLSFTVFMAACDALTADGEAPAPTDWSTKPPQAWRRSEAPRRTAVMARAEREKLHVSINPVFETAR
jgi:hypothetical protein